MKRFREIKHFALDLDGTLYLGGRLFEVTLPFLSRLNERGLGRTFFTNNSSKSSRQYVKKLNELGITATEADLYSSTHATMDYLRSVHPRVKRLFVLGTPALREEFSESGYHVCGDKETDEPDAVVVGFDPTMTYERACRAAWWISRGRPFVATNPDRVCPTDEPTVLVDCGSICEMLKHATGVAPEAFCGKPEKWMMEGVLRRHNLKPEQVAVVGDRIYTDMAMAQRAGAMSILVLSGETTEAQAHAAVPAPDLVVKDVGELAKLLAE
ncbi:MAG TPA: HAD-IIA family hydrolase [Tepidisphaeraceae bacterium]